MLYSPAAIIECSPLPTITNGTISYSPDVTPDYDLGTKATYTCEAGFYLEGSEVRVCMDDDGMDTIGVWSGQQASCVRKLSVKAVSNLTMYIVCFAMQGNIFHYVSYIIK